MVGTGTYSTLGPMMTNTLAFKRRWDPVSFTKILVVGEDK